MWNSLSFSIICPDETICKVLSQQIAECKARYKTTIRQMIYITLLSLFRLPIGLEALNLHPSFLSVLITVRTRTIFMCAYILSSLTFCSLSIFNGFSIFTILFISFFFYRTLWKSSSSFMISSCFILFFVFSFFLLWCIFRNNITLHCIDIFSSLCQLLDCACFSWIAFEHSSSSSFAC